MNSKNRPSDTIRKFFNFFFLISLFFGANFRVSSAEMLRNEQARKFIASSKSEVHFLENKGQMVDMDGRPVPFVFFKMEAPGLDMYITERGLTYVFANKEENKEVIDSLSEVSLPKKIKDEKIKMKWERIDMALKGASIKRENIHKEYPVKGHSNYFFPHCSDGIYETKEYKKISIKNIYPGIDWVFYNSDTKGFKYDFIVHPGADHKQIELVYSSLSPLNLNGEGGMEIKTQLGTLTENAPISYKGRKEIPTQFIIKLNHLNDMGGYDNHIEFAFPDSSLVPFEKEKKDEDLIIDPQLVWSSFYGGNGVDGPMSIDCDRSGNVYITGYTASTDFPVQSWGNAYYQATKEVARDVFIICFSSIGEKKWTTYYGGNSADEGLSIHADDFGNIYVTGWTGSTNFPLQPLTGAYNQPAHGGNVRDAFILRFSTNGLRTWATYYGSSGVDDGFSITSDFSGNIYVTGSTSSTDFPLQSWIGAYNQPANGGNSDAFIVRFQVNGIRTWATYYGGSGWDYGTSIHIDTYGNILATGYTGSLTDFPLQYLAGSYNQSACAGVYDAFVLHFQPNGIRTWATYYGGSGNDQSYCIRADNAGNIYAIGFTVSTDFPIQSKIGAYNQPIYGGGTGDIFVLRFTSNGQRVWATYYGGNNHETLLSYDNLEVDDCGNIYVGFFTQSTNNVTREEGCGAYFDGTYGGGGMFDGDIFWVKFSNAGGVLWASYWGSSKGDWREAIALDPLGNLYITGEWTFYLSDVGLPLKNPGGNTYFDNTPNGNDDGFIAKLIPSTLTYTQNATSGCNCKGSANIAVAGGCSTAYKYIWYDSSWNKIGSNQSINNLCSGNYQMVIRDTISCTKLDTILINISGVIASINQIRSGNNTILVATGGNSYSWSPSEGLSCTACPDPVASPENTTVYCVTVTDSLNCSDTACIKIERFNCEAIFIPTAFSPNNDGQNDIFYLQGECITSYAIFDRWGEKVFETTDITKGWDGTYKGEKLNSDIFTYQLKIISTEGEKKQKTGTVALIR